MDGKKVVYKIDIPGFKWTSGKVRDRTKVDTALGIIAFITTDRISAFDSVLPTPIPGKGVVLNQFSNFWKLLCEPITENDVCGWDHKSLLGYLDPQQQKEWEPALEGRTILVREADKIPVECIVRGYIDGSYWEEYLKMRGVKPVTHDIVIFGHRLPGNLARAQELLMPIFTPSTKAEEGHDQNLSNEELLYLLKTWIGSSPERKRSIGAELLVQALKATSLAIYWLARQYARNRGIIIADTKFEYGFIDGSLVLIDEVLTPDSSRFWDAEKYEPGHSQESFDKQPVRDWLIQVAGWNKEPPAPALPSEVVATTVKRYREVYQRLTGNKL